MKAHQSHDVLLLCPTCHENSKSHDLQLRRKLAETCNAPLAGPLTHTNWRRLHCAIKALRNEPMLPPKRQEELTNIILEYAGQQEITPNLLNLLDEELKNALTSSINQSKQQPHGLKVFFFFFFLLNFNKVNVILHNV